MAQNQVLQIVVFSVLFGIATAAIGEKGKIIIKALDAVSHVVLKMVDYVMMVAPLGVLGAIAGGNGNARTADILNSMLSLLFLFYHRYFAVMSYCC